MKYLKEKEFEIVKRLSGITDSDRISLNETGWTSRTYVVDDGKIIFKFPRNEKYRSECEKEIAVLELLKKHHFDISVPVLNWTTENNAYFGFYGVGGRPLGEVISTLTDEQKVDIGSQLGGFLRQLHSIKFHGEISAQTLEEQVAEYTEMYQENRHLLEAFFDEAELQDIDDFFINEVPKCMTGSGELVFCHGDLDYNNTFVDDELRVGVIDFGDAGLYDRSQDFRGMDDDVLREAMMKAYGDDEIISLAAARATSKMIDILNLPYIIKNRDEEERDVCIARIRADFF